jgi:L-iditol 2-dehydrogenase
MKVRRGAGQLELREIGVPDPGPGQVVLAVSRAGICGTDLHIVADEFPYWPPVVLGHEFTGRVSAVGPGVDPAWAGRRVVCEPHAGACGQCYLCRRGHVQLCADKRSPGWGVHGAFASHLAVPAALLHAVPDQLPDRAAVLAEPMAVVLSALLRCPVTPGDTVVVTGPGPVGLLAAIAARFAGAKAVIVLGRTQAAGSRLAIAAELGFAATADLGQASELVLAASANRGADLLVEASGSAQAISAGIGLLRDRGRVAAVGLSGQASIDVPWDRALRKSLDIVLSSSSAYPAWEPALVVLERCANPAASLVTEFPLAAWELAFQAAERRVVVKAALCPGEPVPAR